MIDRSKQNVTLKVCLEDVGAQNKAILDFFFAKLGQHTFRCVNTQEEANVLLIDYDFPPARQRYEETYLAWQKPALILSISEVSLENTIWLAKPLSSRALLESAGTLQQQLARGASETDQDDSVVKSLEPSNNLATTHSSVLQRPPIQPSLSPVNLPLVDKSGGGGAIVSDAPLERAIAEVPPAANESDQSNNDLVPVRFNEESPNVSDQTVSGVTKQVSGADKGARLLQLCGDNKDVEATVDFSEHQADDSFFLSSLKDAVRLARQCQQGVLLNFPQARIYVLPEIHRIFCGIDINDEEFAELIAACSVAEGGKMHILSTQEIHELNDMISQQTSALYDIEAFIWTSTLLSAKGCLPRELDPKKPVSLKHWPSLTRLESFPHVMPIAALWSAKNMSAFDVAKSLNVPQRYVFSFYNASNSLGLIEQDPEKLINKQSVSRSKDAPKGLFSRLLKRLVGG